MGLFKKKGCIISVYFRTLQDIGQFKTGYGVKVSLFDSYLTLSNWVPPLSKHPITLNYSQITNAFIHHTVETIERIKAERSVIGDAVTGGLLFGETGAVVGAINASRPSSPETKTEIHRLFIIEYISSSGQKAYLLFEDNRLFKGMRLAKKLRKLCGIDEREKREEQARIITSL